MAGTEMNEVEDVKRDDEVGGIIGMTGMGVELDEVKVVGEVEVAEVGGIIGMTGVELVDEVDEIEVPGTVNELGKHEPAVGLKQDASVGGMEVVNGVGGISGAVGTEVV